MNIIILKLFLNISVSLEIILSIILFFIPLNYTITVIISIKAHNIIGNNNTIIAILYINDVSYFLSNIIINIFLHLIQHKTMSIRFYVRKSYISIHNTNKYRGYYRYVRDIA